MRASAPTRLQSLGLWICTLIGGAVAGSGLFLLAQVRVVRYLRQQLDEISGVERFLGKMTFLWRGTDEKVVLALGDIPGEYLDHSEFAAKWLTGIGVLGVAIVLPWFLKRRWSR